jgi:hypothetical protein
MQNMQNIQVHRYSHPKTHGWAGWLEPEDRSWIAFIGLDGRPLFFLNRDPVSGAVLGDDPASGNSEESQTSRRLYTGVSLVKEDLDESQGVTSPAPGEPIFPLGIDGTGGKGIEK